MNKISQTQKPVVKYLYLVSRLLHIKYYCHNLRGWDWYVCITWYVGYGVTEC